MGCSASHAADDNEGAADEYECAADDYEFAADDYEHAAHDDERASSSSRVGINAAGVVPDTPHISSSSRVGINAESVVFGTPHISTSCDGNVRDKRLEKELRQLQNAGLPFIVGAGIVDNDIYHWKVNMRGPLGSPYEQGMFEISIVFPEHYPHKPPQYRFNMKVWHPNISWKTGAVCLEVSGREWSPAFTTEKMLLSVFALLGNPEPQDPMEPEAASMFIRDHPRFVQAATCFSELFASSSSYGEEAQIEKLQQSGFTSNQANIFVQGLETNEDFRDDKGASLSEYFMSQSRGEKPEFPKGYLPEALHGVVVLRHQVTNVAVKAQPLRPAATSDAYTIVYHYAPSTAFFPICESGEIWATLLQTNKNQKDTCHGDGVYTAGKSPCEFGSKEAILVNNYSNAEESSKQQRHIEKHLDCADFCIPLLVPQTSVYDVMKVATPEKCYLPGFNRHGQRLRSDRDIKVVVLQDTHGTVHNAKETSHTLVPLVDHLNKDVRKHALVALARLPESQNSVVTEALLHRLEFERIPCVLRAALDCTEKLIPSRNQALMKILRERLKDPDPTVRKLMAWKAVTYREKRAGTYLYPDLLTLGWRTLGVQCDAEDLSTGILAEFPSVALWEFALRNNCNLLEFAPKKVVKDTVTSFGNSLRFATEEHRGDREIVMAAVTRFGEALEFATEELRGDRALVMAAVRTKGNALRFATEEHRGDRNIVMAAVTQFGEALEFATEELRGERAIVMAAVRTDGNALRFATEELRGDREIVDFAEKAAQKAAEKALQSPREAVNYDTD